MPATIRRSIIMHLESSGVMVKETIATLSGSVTLMAEPRSNVYLRRANATVVVELAKVPQTSVGWDEKSVPEIRLWLKNCSLNHNACRRWAHYGRQCSTEALRPTRLLRVNGDPEFIYLVGDSEIVSDVQYATLSHCWGGNVPVQLTRETMSNFARGYPCHDLPRTFREAVQVARDLGLDFLWIDALCIIQDDAEDWEAEAPKMAYVYSQGQVNLAAAGAEDSRGGLFCQSPTFTASYHAIETSWTEIELGLAMLEPHWAWSHLMTDAKLNTRAWVLQERAIAPRTIYFASDKVWWHCQDFVGHEVRPKGVAVKVEDPTVAIRSGEWTTLVLMYSGLSLSITSDKLAAFAGVARLYGHIHELPEADYLSGVWRSALPGQLLWSAFKPGSPCGHESPSWSWTCVDTAVGFHFHADDDGFVCKVAEVETQPGLTDSFTMHKAGILHVEGHIQKIVTKVRTLKLLNQREAQYLCIGDHSEFLITASAQEAELAVKAHDDCAGVWLDRKAENLEEVMDHAWFLPIAWGRAVTYHSHLPSEDWMMEVVGLLIQRSQNQDGTFKRVGLLIAHQDGIHGIRNCGLPALCQTTFFTKTLATGGIHSS